MLTEQRPHRAVSVCFDEPIHIPGAIQPGGVLFALRETDLTVQQVSANSRELLGVAPEQLLGTRFQELFAGPESDRLVDALRSAALEENPLFLVRAEPITSKSNFDVLAHKYAGQLIVELERSEFEEHRTQVELHAQLRAFILHLKTANDLDHLADVAADNLRAITGFDRVLIYKFDPNWKGHVIGESRDAAVSSHLDLWFPARDIPPQVRRLYEVNRIRLIPDVNYTPVPVIPEMNPDTGEPLDMTFAVLRSIWSVRIQYLKYMGVASAMFIGILKADGAVWGLIACHHRTPRTLSFMTRSMCDLMAQALSIQAEALEQRSEYEERIRLKSVVAELLARMAQEDDVLQGLSRHAQEFLRFGNAEGAVVVQDDQFAGVGEFPPEAEVRRLVDWLIERGREDIFHTDCLPLEIPDGEVFRETASGILAIAISQVHRSFLIWFRPEAIRTVTWAGDPRSAVSRDGDDRFDLPRRSFEPWKEIVRNRSLPWRHAEVEAASDLRNATLGLVLRKAEELAELSAELKRSNTELEAFSYSVSHDLRAPFRHIVGYTELLREAVKDRLTQREERYLGIIAQSAQFAGTLVDNLLSFSQVGRAKLRIEKFDMGRVVEAARKDLSTEYEGRNVEWRIQPLCEVVGDPTMIRSVWQNLIENALKYSRGRDPAIIEISHKENEKEIEFSIKDNGVGFEQAYVSKLFGVFQRLHRMEEFEGTGIGLANVRRIIARHGGRTWAEGEPDKGAQFFFTLPHREL